MKDFFARFKNYFQFVANCNAILVNMKTKNGLRLSDLIPVYHG